MSDREQAESAAAEWIARRGEGWTAQRAEQFAEWLAASTDNRVAYYRLSAAWNEIGRLESLGAAQVVPQILGRASDARFRSRRFFAGLAAGLALAVCAGWTLHWQQGMKGTRYSTVVGGLQALKLAEGSVVTLNSDTAVRIRFRDRERHVELERGEAYFEVTKDATRPFVVQAAGRKVTAIGTAFSVRSEGQDVSLLVSEGKVLMNAPGDALAIRQPLDAGSLVHSSASSVRLEKRSAAEVEQSLSWRTGQLVFRDTPLAEASAQFNRYNARKIVIEDAVAGQIRVGGVFRTTDLDSFLRLIEAGFPVRVVAEPGRVVIRAQ